MFALDCDIYRGTQACLWSGYSEHFCRVIYYDRSLWYTRKRTRGYRVILTLNFFLHHIIRKRENKLCQSPACRYHVLLSNFHDMRCNTWNIKKKNIQNSLNDLMKLSHTGLGTSTCTSGHLSICWRNGVQLYISLVNKNWCLTCPTIMVKANFTILQYHVKKHPIRMSLFLTVEIKLALNRSKQQIVWQLDSPLK